MGSCNLRSRESLSRAVRMRDNQRAMDRVCQNILLVLCLKHCLPQAGRQPGQDPDQNTEHASDARHAHVKAES